MPNADAGLRSVLTSFVNDLYVRAIPTLTNATAMEAKRKGPKHPYVRLVNREAEKLVKAFRVAAKESTRELPGRAQKGAIDAAVRRITPDVAKQLNRKRIPNA